MCYCVAYFEEIAKGPVWNSPWNAVMKKLLLWCFLLGAVGCATDEQSGPSSSKLSDKKFIALFADVIELHRRYVHAPDSLQVERKKLFKRQVITQADIEKFLKDRRDHPEKWDALIVLIQQRFGEATEREMRAFQKTTRGGEK